MAGDWMKVELETPDKPEVQYISGITKIDPDAVVGKLFRVWGWFNKHTQDGHALCVTTALLDRLANHTGFAQAMVQAGWLVERGNTLALPNFDRHNGKSAKKRALASARQQDCRSGSVTNVTHPSRSERDSSVTREEKSKEEKKPADAGSPQDKTIWSVGLSLLTAAGSSEQSARTFLGKHYKTHREKLAEVIARLSLHPSPDPKAYIEKALRESGDGIGSFSSEEMAA